MDCPICDALKSETPLKTNDTCVVIKSPFREGDKIIVSKAHSQVPAPEVYTDAIKLAQEMLPSGMIGDIPDSIGHWAVRLIFFPDRGRSSAKTG